MDDGSKKAKTEVTEGKEATTKKTKASKQSKVKQQNAPRQREQLDGETVVFAFRLGSNDRDRIHDAAGTAKATRFVRAAALAAANGDLDAFKELVASRASK